MAMDILVHGSMQSYICCHLMIHYSFVISLSEVSTENVILSVQILKSETSFTHAVWHTVACYKAFQAFVPF